MAEYIDRQAVNNLLYNLRTHRTIWRITGEIDVNELNSIPTADVRENVKGEWEPRGGYYYCSQCGARYEWGGNFCPNCGADMRKTCDGDSCPI